MRILCDGGPDGEKFTPKAVGVVHLLANRQKARPGWVEVLAGM